MVNTVAAATAIRTERAFLIIRILYTMCDIGATSCGAPLPLEINDDAPQVGVAPRPTRIERADNLMNEFGGLNGSSQIDEPRNFRAHRAKALVRQGLSKSKIFEVCESLGRSAAQAKTANFLCGGGLRAAPCLIATT